MYKNLSLRFLTSGLINSSASYGIYWLLLRFLDYRISYTVSYISGIILAYILNSQIVFSHRINFKSFIFYPLVYFICYLIGSTILIFFVHFLEVRKDLGAILTMICVFPVSFLLNILYFRNSRQKLYKS